MKPRRKRLFLLLALCLGLGLSVGLLHAFGMLASPSTLDWPVEGEKAGQAEILGRDPSQGFGRVMSVGDVNGDGIDDLITTAPYAFDAAYRGGEVYVIPGPLNFHQTYTIPDPVSIIFKEMNDPMAQFGEYLASGDMNGDGFDDIAMGSWVAEKAYVYLGSSDIQASSPITIPVSPQNMALTISPLTSGLAFCDINGDGYQDLFVEANSSVYGGEQLWGILGRPSVTMTHPATLTMPADANIRIEGSDLSGWGSSLSRHIVCGDIDGDKTPDLILSVSSEPNYERWFAGAVFIIKGDPNLTFSSTLTITVPEQVDTVIRGVDSSPGSTSGDNLGASLAVADINLDGRSDLILGAPGADGPDNVRNGVGEVYLWLGRSLEGQSFTITEQASWTVVGEYNGDHLGSAITTGDFDLDGYSEILLGCLGCGEWVNTGDLVGKGYVFEPLEFSGTVTVTDVSQLNITTYIGSPCLGRDVAAMDLDHNGIDDLVLSAPCDSPLTGIDLPGTIYAISYPIRTRIFLPFIQH